MFCTLALMLLPAVQAPEAQTDAPPDAGPQLQEVARQLAKAPAYRFRVEVRDEGAVGRGPGGPRAMPPVDGVFQKGLPVHLKQGDTEAWLAAGGILIYQDAEGTWQRLERDAMPPGGRRGGFGRRQPTPEAEPEGEGGPPPGGFQPGGERFALFALSRFRPPEHLFRELAGKVEDVQLREEEGRRVFTGRLTPEGAEALSGFRMRMPRRRLREGEPAPGIEHSGDFELVVGADGRPQELTIHTTVSGSFRERTFERKRTTRVLFSDWGAVELPVPEEVRALLQREAAGDHTGEAAGGDTSGNGSRAGS